MIFLNILFSFCALILSKQATSAEPMLEDNNIKIIDSRENKNLLADQVYAILAGSIAERRGQLAIAFTQYLQAAQLTNSAQLAKNAVLTAVRAENDADAMKGLQLWLTLAPTAPAAHQVAAILCLKTKNYPDGVDHLTRLIELTADNLESAYFQVVTILTNIANTNDRIELMQTVISRFPENADAQLALAQVAASVSRFDLASQAAQRSLELRPSWDQPRLFVIKLRISEGKRPEARQLLVEFVHNDPDNRALNLLYGQFLLEEQDFTAARELFTRLAHNLPNEPEVLFALGNLALKLDDLAGAKTYFTQLYESKQRQGEAAYYLGQTAERAKDPAAAIAWYSKVHGVSALDAQIRIAYLRAKAGEIAQAREILQQLRGRSPEDAVSLYLIETEILIEINHQEDAWEVFKTALNAYPNEIRLLYSRATFAIQSDQLQLAESDLRQIIALQPNHVDSLNALGYILADRTDRYAEARELIERAYALKPDEPEIIDSMGWVQYRLGQYATARDYLQRALDKLDDGEIAAHLGEVLWALDRHVEAWAVWKKAQTAHPDHVYLKQVIQKHQADLNLDTVPQANESTNSSDKTP